MELGEEIEDPAAKAKKLPWLQRKYGELKEGVSPGAARAMDTSLFVLAFFYLNWFVNAATPWSEPFVLAWAFPAPTVVLILLLFALSAWLGRRPYFFVLPAIALFVVLPLRIFRWVDLAVMASLGRPFAGTDLASFQDLMVFVNDVVPFSELTSTLFGLVVAVGLGLFVAKQALAGCFNFLRHAKPRLVVVSALTLLALISLVLPSSTDRWGLFAPPRGLRMAQAWLDSMGEPPDADAKRTEIAAAAQRLESTASRLDVDERHVVFLVLGSYGMDVFGVPHRSALASHVEDLATTIEAAEFHVRSHQLRAPVRGAQSELAHATLTSGTKITAHGHIDLLRELEPTTLATLFGRSGYATFRLMPAETREGPMQALRYLGFFTTYRAWELGYQGSSFGWVSVPDQYTLDIMHRRDLCNAGGPIFVQAELLGMRPPWTEQPPYVEDWNTIEDGALFETLSALSFVVEGLELNGAHRAYQHAVAHTMKVLGAFFTEPSDCPPAGRGRRRRRRRPPPLYVIVGDHPPLAQIGNTAEPLVPIHVLSRDEAVLAPFEARGYVDGFEPTQDAPLEMADFAHAFAQDFAAPAEAPE